MKKVILGFFMLFTFLITTQLSAQNGIDRGDTQTRTETTECPSGIKRKCEGLGTYCEFTLGWDCEIVPE